MMLANIASAGTRQSCIAVKPGHPGAVPIATQRISSHGVSRRSPLVGCQQLRQVHTLAASRDPQPIDPLGPSQPISSRRRIRDSTDSIRDAGDAVGDAVEDVGDAASEAVDQAADTTADVIRSASNAAQDAVLDTQQAATSAVQDVTDSAQSAARDTARAVTDATQQVQATAAAVGDQVLGGSTPAVDFRSAGVLLDQRFEDTKVLVTGATGGVGRRVIQALRAKGISCRALVRDTARAANLLPPPTSYSSNMPDFEIVKGDVYQYSTLPRALEGCNALVVCTAANDKADPFGPFNIDYQGTLNLIAAAKRKGVKRFVFVTSIGADDVLNPLNLFWGILFWKKRAEEELQRSGLSYTIVRPGGLKNKLAANEYEGNIVMKGPNTFGFPPFKKSGSILRSQVADVCVEALVNPAAADKVVEIIAEQEAPAYTLSQLFENVYYTDY